MQLHKYMSALALFDVILNRRLYFHPLNLMEDQWEGIPLPREAEVLRELGKRDMAEWGLTDPEIMLKLQHAGRLSGCVSCWHRANSESIAMWKIYAGTGQGCCLVCDEDKMVDWSATNSRMSYFPVQYVDRDSHMGLVSPVPGLFHSVHYKHLAYQYEQECRFLLSGSIVTKRTVLEDGSIWTEPDLEKSALKEGIYAPFDLPRVADRVVVSPFLKKYEQDVIAALISRVSESTVKVETSRLPVK